MDNIIMNIMEHVIQAINELKTEYTEDINAIETGTIRSYTEKHESTRHIATALNNRGTLISVDINPKSIEISKNICKGLSNTEYVISDSHKYLRSICDKKFHFALLDSVNDKDFIMQEFKLILPLMHTNGIIMIDDAGITSDGTKINTKVSAQKAHSVWELLYNNNIKFCVVTTVLGHGTQLKIKLDNDTITKIKGVLNDII